MEKTAGTTRRNAIVGTAVTGLGLMSATALAHADEAKEVAQTWDKEVKVLVAGTGTAIYAAIACSEFGCDSILLVDKSENVFGGTSGVSGGTHALPLFSENGEPMSDEQRAAVLEYLDATGEGRMDTEVMEAFIDTSYEFGHFVLDTMNWTWDEEPQFVSYYEYYPAGGADGPVTWSSEPFDAEGNPLNAQLEWAAYRAYVDEHPNIELLMGTAVESLVIDGTGAVVGAVLSDGTCVKADAVVLGTGGFEHNAEMRRLYLPSPFYRTNSFPTNTGDGQRMGAKIGAQLAYMDAVFGCPYYVSQPEWSKDDDFVSDPTACDCITPRGFAHSVLVNHKGKRFCDEAASYDSMNRAFATYDTGTQEYVNIPGFWICDSAYTESFLLPGGGTPEDHADFVFKFDTLEELADGMGIDKESLIAEIASFNEYAAQGLDPVWHRGEKVESDGFLNMMYSYKALFAADTAPEGTLGTIEQGPFYCVRYVPGMMGGTRGGLLINANAQVKNVDGEPIPGLYATGNCSSGVAAYFAAGATLAQGAVMAYRAAKHIMGK